MIKTDGLQKKYTILSISKTSVLGFSQDALWNLITYCAATGGSLLVIGSAAGVAFMGMASWLLPQETQPTRGSYRLFFF